jgi:single-stranded-DNA-specific exonuclease
METYHKPVFVLQELGDETKGSARSFGDFSLAEAIENVKKLIIKGGGHDAAAGVTLLTKNIGVFRKTLNEYHHSLKLHSQAELLQLTPDVTLDSFEAVDEALIAQIATLEPFGHGNHEPRFSFDNLLVADVRLMGDKKQHIKLLLKDTNNHTISMLAFSAPAHFFVNPGDTIKICCSLSLNEWQGNRSIEGKILELELI